MTLADIFNYEKPGSDAGDKRPIEFVVRSIKCTGNNHGIDAIFYPDTYE
jgi:hypothetical protein